MKIKTSTYSFADYSASRRKIRSQFFNQINRLIDWEAVRRMLDTARLKPKRKKDGRPCYDSLVLFRIELLRVWYGLSDGEIEDQVNDRLSFSSFAGIGLEDDVPDSTTICRFRNSLVSANAYEALLNEINRQLEAAGVLVKSGAIVDASVTDSLRRPRGRKVYEMVEDRHEDEQKQDGKGDNDRKSNASSHFSAKLYNLHLPDQQWHGSLQTARCIYD